MQREEITAYILPMAPEKIEDGSLLNEISCYFTDV